MRTLYPAGAWSAAFLLSLMAWSHAPVAAVAQAAYDPMRPPHNETVDPPLEGAEDGTPALNPDFDNLPDTDGVEETYYTCSVCHSLAIIKQQRITDARWHHLWDWMIAEQGMPEPDSETKEIVLNYLTTHFSSER
jgi:hypothetical protein